MGLPRMEVLAEVGGWTCHYCGCQLLPRGADRDDDRFFTSQPPPYQRGERTAGLVDFDDGPRYLRPGVEFPVRDHVVPRCDGGPDTVDNLVLSCGRCNNRKGRLPYETFVGAQQG